MHILNICHGDLKDEHIFVHIEKNGEYNFKNIRIIDFGSSYLETIEGLKGSSIGFTPPHYWLRSGKTGLQRKYLKLLDWYGCYAVLYYAFMGETFPTASPAYREIVDISLRNFSNDLHLFIKNENLKRWRGQDECMSPFLSEIINYLTNEFVIE